MIILKVMADYYCFPIWESSSNGYYNVDPRDMGISDGLALRLIQWAEEFDGTLNHDYPPDSGFNSEERKLIFQKAGAELAEELRREVGNKYHVVYRPPP